MYDKTKLNETIIFLINSNEKTIKVFEHISKLECHCEIYWSYDNPDIIISNNTGMNLIKGRVQHSHISITVNKLANKKDIADIISYINDIQNTI